MGCNGSFFVSVFTLNFYSPSLLYFLSASSSWQALQFPSQFFIGHNMNSQIMETNLIRSEFCFFFFFLCLSCGVNGRSMGFSFLSKTNKQTTKSNQTKQTQKQPKNNKQTKTNQLTKKTKTQKYHSVIWPQTRKNQFAHSRFFVQRVVIYPDPKMSVWVSCRLKGQNWYLPCWVPQGSMSSCQQQRGLSLSFCPSELLNLSTLFSLRTRKG